MQYVIGIGLFISIVLIIEGIYFTYITGKKSEEKKVKKRLRILSRLRLKNEETDILRKTLLSEVSWFNALLLKFPHLIGLERLLEQANTKYSLGVYILLTFLLVVCGYVIGSFVSIDIVIKLLFALCLGSLPYVSLNHAKNKRMRKFERQLPDALDLIVRALKAGHAFSGGLKMVADEFEDPVGTEFAKVLDEINFGVGVPEALVNLTERVDCAELKFFIVSVIIQRETGGNLAEILSKISHLIRERFKLQGRVSVLSAEGKMSAIVLIAIPVLLVLYLLVFSPDYLQLLLINPIGRIMVAGAIIMMILGVIIMKKMVSIKV